VRDAFLGLKELWDWWKGCKHLRAQALNFLFFLSFFIIIIILEKQGGVTMP
jgi:hypothetical protein